MQVWLHPCWRAYTEVWSRQKVVRSNATVQGWVRIISALSALLGLCVWEYMCMSLYSFCWRVSSWLTVIVLTLLYGHSLYIISYNKKYIYNSVGSLFCTCGTCFLKCKKQQRIGAQLYLQYCIHEFLYMNRIFRFFLHDEPVLFILSLKINVLLQKLVCYIFFKHIIM